MVCDNKSERDGYIEVAEAKSVFISYSSQDKKIVDKITTVLDEMEVSYWIAPDMIPVGSNYAKEIPQAIRDCHLFLLILSEKSMDSIWVEKEIDSAICCKKRIVPLKIDETPMNDVFRFYLNNVQMIPYYEGEEIAIKMLKKQIHLLPSADSVQPIPQKQGTKKHDTLKFGASIGNRRTVGRGTGNYGGRNVHGRQQEEITEEIYTVGPRMRQEGLSLNRVPIDCKFCGGKVNKIGRGIYQCVSCEKENYDYFQIVRLYLDRFGATPALIIERETGVPRKAIEQFLRQEYLEIPSQSPIRMYCENCGAPIRTGYLCDQCKKLKGFMPNYSNGSLWRSSRMK